MQRIKIKEKRKVNLQYVASAVIKVNQKLNNRRNEKIVPYFTYSLYPKKNVILGILGQIIKEVK
jgi:hypothetical protein